MKYALILLTTLLWACDRPSHFDDQVSSYDLSVEEEIGIEPPRTAEPPTPERAAGAKLIKTGTIAMNTHHLEQSKQEWDQLISKYGGYYSQVNYGAPHEHSRYYDLIARIPAASFDSIIHSAEAQIATGDITQLTLSQEDVTRRYDESDISLNNNKAYLKRYLELLKKAKTVKDMVEVQGKLQEVEEDIKIHTGHLNYLTKQIEYSSLHIILSEEQESKSDTPRIIKAMKEGWQNMVSILLWIVSLWPIIILVIIAGGIFWLRRR